MFADLFSNFMPYFKDPLFSLLFEEKSFIFLFLMFFSKILWVSNEKFSHPGISR